MLRKSIALLLIAAAVIIGGCFGKENNNDNGNGVTLVRNGERVQVLAEDEIAGGRFVVDAKIEAENVVVEADKMKIVEVKENKTYIAIVDMDTPSVEGDKVFELKNCSEKVNVELEESINEKTFSKEMKKAYKNAEKKGFRGTTTDSLLGDFNKSNTVELADFMTFKSNYGSTVADYDIAPATTGTGDYADIYSKCTPDGSVGLLDFLVFGRNYGKSIIVPTVTEVKLTGNSSATIGSTVLIYANTTYSDGTVKNEVVDSWSSSDETIATVAGNGEYAKVTGLREGFVTIKASKNGKVGELLFSVNYPSDDFDAQTIEITGGNSVAIGGTLQLTATATFIGGTTSTSGVTWSSSNKSVATVDSTGKVTGVAGGIAKIKAVKNSVSHEITVVVATVVNGVKVHAKGYTTAYVWEGSNVALSAGWPGTTLTTTGEPTGWGYFYVEGKDGISMVLSNAGAGKTGDLTGIKKGEHWYVDGKWYDYNPEQDFTAPVITSTPEEGNQEGATLEVALTAKDNSDTAPKIYYTTDGTAPTASSKLYSSKITISKDTELKAIAVDSNSNISKIYIFKFYLNKDATAPVITATPAAGRYTIAQSVKLTATDNKDSSVTIYYTTDGSEPKAELANMYNGQTINVSKAMTIKALAVDSSKNSKSTSFAYYIGTSTTKYNDFREESIYFMMTDRFADGDTSNNNIWGDEYLPNGASDMYKYDESKTGVLSYYHGGDFAGVIKNLDYLQDMGFTAVWITPAAKQPEGRYYWEPSATSAGGGDAYAASGFHGYWAYDFDKIDPHLHSQGKASDGWADFQKLADALHARGMKLMLDVVINHGHPGDSAPKTKWEKDELNIIMDGKTWTYDSKADTYGSDTISTKPYVRNGFFNYSGDYKLSSLLDFNERGESGKDAREHLKNVFKKYIDHGVDAMRIDTAAYVTNEWMGEFADSMANYAKTKGNDYFYLMSEGWCGRYDAIQRAAHDKTGALHMIDMQASCLDFPGQMVNVFKTGGDYASFKTFTSNDETQGIGDASFVGMFVDNHDCFRANGVFSETEYKDALNYIYFFRGIPIVYYGTEAMYSWDGAKASTNKEDVVSRWMLGQVGIDYVKSKQPPMYKHLKMLNEVRKKCEGVQKGKQVNLLLSGDKAVLKREFGDKSAYVAISKGAGYSQTFDSMESGTYLKITTDTATGSYKEETVTVSGSATVAVNAHSVVILQKK